MKQKLLIFMVLIFLVVLLAGLNAATYVQKEKVPDTELAPNRSTYNPGSTGAQALYTLLAETGRNVTRWRSSLDTIASETKDRPSVFVMIGPLRRELSDEESTQLMQWVAKGGTLVLIDRMPPSDLVMTTSQWQISIVPEISPEQFTVDASDQRQMTGNTPAQKPAHPSTFADGVNGIQPSRFASTIKIERYREAGAPTGTSTTRSTEAPPPSEELDEDESAETPRDAAPHFEAPVIHVGSAARGLLVEAPFSEGRVIVLSDPYVVSNNGINLADNSRLAVNLIASRGGLIAFDEYHQGYGDNNNRFFQYFEGTPVIAIFLQCGLILALVLFSQSRRFARPIPEPEASRLSKLEYVSAMAELQQRTRAFDLAIENIYADFRRRASALVGLDNTTSTRKELAERIAERIGGPAREIEELLFQCEDIIHGEPVRKKDVLGMVEKIRQIEDKLGLRRSAKKGL